MPTPTKNPGKISFEGLIEGEESGGWVSFPYDLKELYGIGNLIPAVMTFDGIIYRGSIAKMGGPHPMLLIKKEIRGQLGKKTGDRVAVTVVLDTEPRIVELPIELKKAFASSPEAKTLFDKMAYSHRREYAQWIGSAKQSETRQRRAQKAIQEILAKKQNELS